MSHDPFVFKGPVPRSAKEFTERLGRFEAGDEAKYPGLEDLRDEKVDDSLMDPQSGLIIHP